MENQSSIPPRIEEWIEKFREHHAHFHVSRVWCEFTKINLRDDIINKPHLIERTLRVIDKLETQDKNFQNRFFRLLKVHDLESILDLAEFVMDSDFSGQRDSLKDLFVDVSDRDTYGKIKLEVFTPFDMMKSNNGIYSESVYHFLERKEFVVKIALDETKTFKIGETITETLDFVMDYLNLKEIIVQVTKFRYDDDFSLGIMGVAGIGSVLEIIEYRYKGDGNFFEIDLMKKQDKPTSITYLPDGIEYYIFIPGESL